MCQKGAVSLNIIHHPQGHAIAFLFCKSREVRIRQLQARYLWAGGIVSCRFQGHQSECENKRRRRNLNSAFRVPIDKITNPK